MNKQLVWGLSIALVLSPALAQQGKPLATAEHESGVKVELLSVKRDSATVVTVSWRYRNETGKAQKLTGESSGWIDPYRLSLNTYLLDEEKRVKYPVSQDPDRRPIASRNGEPNGIISIRPKASTLVWAKYIVPESVTKVTVTIDGVMPFSEIAITPRPPQ